MSRKKKWIGVGFLTFIIATSSVYLTFIWDDGFEDYDWGASYSVTITAEENQSYSVIVPIPIHADYQTIRNSTGDYVGTIRTNETLAGFLPELTIEEENGSFEIVQSDRGIGLRVNGTGNITIIAEKRGTHKERKSFVDEFLGNHMSLMEENGTDFEFNQNFSVHSSSNTTEILVEMKFHKWFSYEEKDGDVIHHDHEIEDWSFTGKIAGEGWTIVPGSHRAIACG